MSTDSLQNNVNSCTSLTDSHVHLDADAFDVDRNLVLDRARAAGVGHMIIPATTAAHWPRLATLCRARPHLHGAYGLHPMFLRQHEENHLDRLPEWLDEHHAVAVGECGLDFFIDAPQADRQRHYFRRQLEIARDMQLPVIIHARRAVEEVIHTLREVGHLQGVVHSFAGSREQARQLADIGFMVGIGGPVTHEQAKRLRRTVADIPLDTLLLEPDAPDQPGALHKGQRNEPAWLTEVLDVIASLRDEDAATIAQATSANASRLFGLRCD